MPKRSTTSITEKTVRRKPAEKPFEIRDSELRGFILRIQPSGTKTFYCEWARGKRSRIGDASLMTVTRARDIARDRISGAKNGEIPDPQLRGATPTLQKFVEGQYSEWAKTHQKAGDSNTQRILSAFSDFLPNQLHQITHWQTDKWKSQRKATGTNPATINRDLAMLKAALNKAVEWGVIGVNPVLNVKRFKGAENARVRYLSDVEEKRLMVALETRESRIRKERKSHNQWLVKRGKPQLPAVQEKSFADYLYPMVLVSLNTGTRYGELSSLEWASVRLTDSPIITAQAAHTKASKTRHIPLNKNAAEVLRLWKQHSKNHTGFVFPAPNGGKIGSVRTAWKAVLTAAEITDFRWHDLRHTFASRLVMAGVDLNTVRELLGHRSLDMTLRYSHLAPEKMANAVANLEDRELARS